MRTHNRSSRVGHRTGRGAPWATGRGTHGARPFPHGAGRGMPQIPRGGAGRGITEKPRGGAGRPVPRGILLLIFASHKNSTRVQPGSQETAYCSGLFF